MAMDPTIKETNFELPGQVDFYRGKVRDVYILKDVIVVVATDRISAFDVVLPRLIPYKGAILNQIAGTFLNNTSALVPNWLEATPDPNVSIGKQCEPFPVEMVVRSYLVGHVWREYDDGKREICGAQLPEGLKENSRFHQPIITPTTKAKSGHDQDISRKEIIEQGLMSENEYEEVEAHALKLFAFGSQYAKSRGLILVDTKYEFGKHSGKIHLIDEVHTPDSSRYFYLDGYEERLKKDEPQKQLSKEFVREWLMHNQFEGKEGQVIPEMDDKIVKSISERYIELYEKVTGDRFRRGDEKDIPDRIETNILSYLDTD